MFHKHKREIWEVRLRKVGVRSDERHNGGAFTRTFTPTYNLLELYCYSKFYTY